MHPSFSFRLKIFIGVLLLVLVFCSGFLVNSALQNRSEKKVAESTVEPTAQPSPTATKTDENKESAESVASSSGRQRFKVARVVDGDTIEIETGQKIRLIGIDTPETVKPNTPVQCFGKEASNKTKELLEGKEIEVEKDVSETDRYGRLLRYVFLDDIFVNQYLVGEGYAYASTFPPDVKYESLFREAQRTAQEENKGLWSSCPVDSKKRVNAPTSPVAVVTAAAVLSATSSPKETSSSVIQKANVSPISGECKIKGNISTSGKIYHLPGCGSYDKTTININDGERWFCTEEEAVQAGWRKAKNC